MITTHEELLKLHGKRVTCKIYGNIIDDAKICVEDDNIFICQNIKNGNGCKDRLGYNFSWNISDSNDKYEKFNQECTNIELVEEPKINSGEIILSKEQYEEINNKLKEGLKLVTPAIINDAEETWKKFTDAWSALYHKAEKIKSKKSLETLTAKIKEL